MRRDAGFPGEVAVRGQVLDGSGWRSGCRGGRGLVFAAGAVRPGWRGVDDESVRGLDRIVPAVVCRIGPVLAGDRAVRPVHDLAGARWAVRLGCRAAAGSGMLLAGPGTAPVRGDRRINAVLVAVRAMVVHAVAAGQAGGHLVPLLYEVADDRDLPGAARGEDAGMAWRMRARHRLHEPERPSTGPPMPTSSRCSGRAARRGTG